METGVEMLNLDSLIKEWVLEERVCPLGCLLCRCWLQEEVVVAGLGQLGSVGLQEGGGQLQGVQVHHQVRAQLPVTQPGQKFWHWRRNKIFRISCLMFSWWKTEVGRVNLFRRFWLLEESIKWNMHLTEVFWIRSSITLVSMSWMDCVKCPCPVAECRHRQRRHKQSIVSMVPCTALQYVILGHGAPQPLPFNLNDVLLSYPWEHLTNKWIICFLWKSPPYGRQQLSVLQCTACKERNWCSCIKMNCAVLLMGEYYRTLFVNKI